MILAEILEQASTMLNGRGSDLSHAVTALTAGHAEKLHGELSDMFGGLFPARWRIDVWEKNDDLGSPAPEFDDFADSFDEARRKARYGDGVQVGIYDDVDSRYVWLRNTETGRETDLRGNTHANA